MLANRRGAVARPAPVASRLSIGNDGHFHFNGAPIILRGVNFGHETFYRPGDAALSKAMGANIIRIPVRAWSPPVGDGKGDGYDPTSPVGGFINIDYFNTICAAVREIKSLHTLGSPMFVNLAFDSNCGQAERVGEPNCDIGGSPSTFWNPNAVARKQNHKNSIVAYLKTNLGLVDLVEPLVEPHPTVTWPVGQGLAFDNTDIMTLQEEIMQYVQPVDPALCWLIGGLSYFINRFGFPAFMARSDWVRRQNVAFTPNMLDGKISDTLAGLTANTALMTDFRAGYLRPVYINQLGIRSDSDPGYTLQDRAYGLFASPPNGGGSISYAQWELVGDTGQSYGAFKQADAVSPRTSDDPRIASMTAGFALPRLYS